ncbi:MAG: phosphoribosylformylglycinamidine synthase subunit PurQ, partial [Lachnospiraceae bacterium]|nr:phosphoribosylformylglycinamidine synthase subunit PurQ [Lachnospiraceae bacterium]
GLSERFDSTIGAGTVLMPFGGNNQITPIQAMVQKISVEKKHTDTCSLMSWGYNPFITEKSPYHGAYLAVAESIAKLIATGAKYKDIYLTFQEFFEKPMKESKRWGKPLCALLGALKAQLDYEAAAIGGKDSMSGSFEKLDVPPTLVSFAVTTTKIGNIISPEFKAALNNVYLLEPERDEHGIPTPDSMKKNFAIIEKCNQLSGIKAMYTPGIGGIAEAVMKMCFGNSIGFRYADSVTEDDIFSYSYGSFIIEVSDALERKGLLSDLTENAKILGRTEEEEAIFFGSEKLELADLLKVYNGKLEKVFPMETASVEKKAYEKFDYNENVERISYNGPTLNSAKPKILIPAFPGTNCEFDSAKASRDAGFDPEIIVIKNLTADAITDSVNYFANAAKDAQAIFLPGGFSGGDEPDGSAKFIIAFLRNPKVTEAVENLLYKNDGLMCGICNGFQALLKSGLLPYGHIIETDENSATLTFNTIGRHQSKIVRTRVCSTKSPWLADTKIGDVYNVAISHGEGRFFCDEAQIRKLAANGQIATQYVDLTGTPTSDILFNPNNSAFAIEGIISPDGRIFGKMGHSERYDKGLYKNVAGNYEINMFKAAAKYFA